MKMLRNGLIAGSLVLALGGVLAPAASAAEAAPFAPDSVTAPSRTYNVTRQCQIVRISDNNVVGYQRADGSGNTEQAAVLAADRNIPVPPGHYKRHCQTKRVY